MGPIDTPSFHARLRSASITLVVAAASYDIWWTYRGAATRDLEAMNELPTFFRYDEEAHFRNVIVSLYALYDSHKGTLTIKSLIHELDEPVARPIWREYRKVQDEVQKVAYLRHNVIAHRNPNQSYDDLFKEAGLRPDDLKRLIDDSLALLSSMAKARDMPEPALTPYAGSDAAKLLRLLKHKLA